MIATALNPIYAMLAEVPHYGAKIAFQSNKGTILSAQDGGPAVGKPFVLIGAEEVTAWETWVLNRGK